MGARCRASVACGFGSTNPEYVPQMLRLPCVTVFTWGSEKGAGGGGCCALMLVAFRVEERKARGFFVAEYDIIVGRGNLRFPGHR